MSRSPLIAMTFLLSVAACGPNDGSGNAITNWFNGTGKVEMMEPAPVTAEDARPLVDQVVSMSVEPSSGGAIVHALGLPPTQGWWEGVLVEDESEEARAQGRLNFRFEIFPPVQPTPVSTQRSRELTVGVFVSNRDLEGIREITVIGARNARSSRR